jgi:glycosyltransferase involved in cell wall biosynthesis
MSFSQQSSWLKRANTCAKMNVRDERWAGDLREFEGGWNRLCFGRVRRHMRIAGFVKKWPVESAPGGMERHAQIVYRDLASRGHEVHIFTVNASGENITDHTENTLHVHLLQAPPAGALYSEEVWEMFLEMNASSPFDIVHTESKALPPWKARGKLTPTVATWHGIAAEAIHSDIALERNRKPAEPRSEELESNLVNRLSIVVEESKIFSSYDHHIAITDFVADVLRTIYEFPVERVHTIFNGVGDGFHPDAATGAAFKQRHNVPGSATLIFGAGGRLVRDKGHPLLFEAFAEIMQRHPSVFLLVAGSGPWQNRYAKLAPNVIALGPLPAEELNGFYNAIDVFVDPTLRTQGLDTTLLEALQCGKPLLATHFSSITWSVIINKAIGSTFAANAEAMVAALESTIRDGRAKLAKGALVRREYAQLMFRAEQMGAAYERLFLCLVDQRFCAYPLATDSCGSDDEENVATGFENSLGRVS